MSNPYGFYLRTKDGKLKTAFMGKPATTLMRDLDGHWEGMNFKKTGRENVFVIDSAGEYFSQNYEQALVIYFFEGDYLVPM